MLVLNRIIDAFQIFKKEKFISIITLIGIMVGVAACVIFLRLTDISKYNIEKIISALGQNQFIATLLPVTQLSQSLQSEIDFSHWQIFLEHNKDINLLPYSQFNIADTMILAVPPDIINKIKFKWHSGRALTDLDRFSKVAVIGYAHPMADRIGDSFLVNAEWITVIGVFEALAPPLWEVNLNEAVLIHWGLSEQLGWENAVDLIWGEGDKIKFKAYFELYFKGYGLHLRDSEFYVQQFSKQLKTYQNVLLQISIISLFLGGINFFNLRLLTLHKRQQEIGIRMAIGARSFDIACLFQIESLILGALGGGLGIILSEILTYSMSTHLKWDYYIAIGPYFSGIVLAVVLSFIAGLYPAILAARSNPAYLLSRL